MIDYGCKDHEFCIVRDGECLQSRPTETINLCNAAVSPSVLAQIATHLETWGKVTVINAAIPQNPGGAAMMLGEKIAEVRMELQERGKL